MKAFNVTQFDIATCEEMGEARVCAAETAEQCAADVLAARRPNDPDAFIGPTGRVVYCADGIAYVVTPRRDRTLPAVFENGKRVEYGF